MQPNQPTFFKKYKKQIIALSILVLIFGLLVYFLLFYNKNKTNSGDNKGVLSSLATDIGNFFGIKGNNGEENPNSENGEEGDIYFESLIKVWDKPVAGYGFSYVVATYQYTDENNILQTATYTKTILNFVDSETGYIYKKDLEDAQSRPEQVTNSSFPNVQRAYFINGGRVFLQYASAGNIKTISGNVPDYVGQLLNIANLPDNIKNISISPNGNRAMYIVTKNKTIGGRNDSYSDWYLINNPNETYGSRVYSSDLDLWKGLVTNSGNVYAYTTETAYEKNSLYKLIISSGLGQLEQIYGDHTGIGFTVNGSTLLTSMFTGSGLRIFSNENFDGKNFSDSNLSEIRFKTLANKCTIENTNGKLIICAVPKDIKIYDSGLPDAWYQGMTTWKDDLYLINSDYPNGELLFDFVNDANIVENIDAKNLAINKTGSHLFFINKNDGALWSLNIINILDQGGD